MIARSPLELSPQAVRRRRSFTLVELMITISIMAILASATLFALYGVQQDAREARTRSQIARLHELIVTRWDSYQGRAIPVQIPAGTSPRVAALTRLEALRELMRMELPDRKSDVVDAASVLSRTNPSPPPPNLPLAVSLWRAYQRQAIAQLRAQISPAPLPNPWHQNWTEEHQGSECLYLIVSTIHDGDNNGLDFFRPAEIGDTDGDGMKELLDGWGKPIEFLRWAPGFLAGSDIQVRDSDNAPDPFDPLKVDPRWTPTDGDPTNDPYALYPLIFSAGRDEVYDVAVDYDTDSSTSVFDPFRYSVGNLLASGSGPFRNDPYHTEPTSLGNGFGWPGPGAADNLTNHLLGAN